MKRRTLAAAIAAASLIGAGCGGAPSTVVPRPGTIPTASARPDGYTPASPSSTPFAFSHVPAIDVRGLQLVEGFEGFSSCPYRDTVGTGTPYTRGYGETEGISRFSRCIGRAEGERNLKYRLEHFYGWAIAGLGVPFNQNQVDALYSFTWNLGAGIFTGSLRSSLQRHNPFPMLAYDHAQGVVLLGLALRRRAEVALFLKPAHEETPAQHRARLHRERTARLHADYWQRTALDGALRRGNCLHGYDHYTRRHRDACTKWRARHAAVNRDIKHLLALGIR